MFLHLCVSAFGRQLHFPGQPWSGWAHLSAMWGKITPSYSTILLPKLWLCDFFIRASFYYLSYWISLVQYLRFPWQSLYSLWNLSLLPQILLDLGSVKYHRRRNGKRHNIVSPVTAENQLLGLGKQWKMIYPPFIWEKSPMSFYILCFTLAAILCTFCYLEWASWFSSTTIIKPHWNCNYTGLQRKEPCKISCLTQSGGAQQWTHTSGLRLETETISLFVYFVKAI